MAVTDVCYISGRKRVRRVTVAGGGEGTDWSTFQEKATTYGDEKPGLRACAVRAVDVEEPDEEKEWALVGTLLEIRHIASLT